MGAGAGICQRVAGCEGCACRDAAIAQLKADRDAAERRAAEASCALAFECERREGAEARHQATTDRLEFVEPMYTSVRARYEDLYSRHRGLLEKCDELEAEKAALGESLVLVKRQAARAASLEARNRELEEHVASRDREMRRLLTELQRHVKGRVVYPPGPNTPPSEARERREDGGGAGSGLSPQQQQRQRRGGRGKPRRKIPGRPGGRKGHRGHGISFDPNAETSIHKFPRRADGSLDLPQCPCGKGCWDLGDWITRIIRDIKFVIGDTRHLSERAACTGCGVEAWASDGIVPRDGAYGANLVAFVVLLRDHNVK